MRIVKDVDEKENFRLVPVKGTNIVNPKREFIEPEPVGTIVLLPFRITGYERDCDGSAMAKLENIFVHDDKLCTTGWNQSCVGIKGDLIVTDEEYLEMHRKANK